MTCPTQTSSIRLALFVSLSLALAACGSEGSSGDPPVVATGDTEAHGQVDADAGTLTLTNGTAVVVPEGALAAPVEIGVSVTDGLPADVPQGPDGRAPKGDVLTTTPHGQAFQKGVEIRLPLPEGVGSARLTLYTQPGDPSSAWTPVTGVTFDEEKRLGSVKTEHFSHWAWFEVPQGPASISADGMLDTAAGFAYWPHRRQADGRWELRRSSLEDGASYEVLYEESTPDADVRMVAVGAQGVFFYRPDAGKIAKMGADGSDLDADWADVSGVPEGPQTGFTTSTDLWVFAPFQGGDKYSLRIPLATGTPAPHTFSLSSRCALAPDETHAACGYYVNDLVNGTRIQPKDNGTPVGNGANATDGTSWFFTQNAGIPDVVYKAAYGSPDAAPLSSTQYAVDHAAILGSTLFVGGEGVSKIFAIDTTTGEELAAVSVSSPPNALLEVDDAYVYFGTFGGSVERKPLSDFGL